MGKIINGKVVPNSRKGPQIGDKKIMICAYNGRSTLMEYSGHSDEDNGHPGWHCLQHYDNPEDISEEDRVYL